MGVKLNFNIEDAGLSVDGTESIDSSRGMASVTISADKIDSGTIASARLPYTITTTAPVSVSGTSSGHVWYVY